MGDYHYKKSDDREADIWRPVRSIRKAKKNFLILICFILALAFWHIFHTQSRLREVTESDVEHPATKGKAAAHQRLHEHRKSKPKTDEVGEITEQKQVNQGSVVLTDTQQQLGKDGQSTIDNDHAEAKTVVKTGHGTAEELLARSDDTSDEVGDSPKWKKGPVQVEANLNSDHAKEPVLSAPDTNDKQKVIEAEPEEHLVLEETAESLPEILHFPFEETVKDQVLEGWEDRWLSTGKFDNTQWSLKEPKIDFVYLWVNGSEEAFQATKKPFEENSVLNDIEGKWISSHGVNRYRDWDELRYAVRSVEKHASTFRNQIQIIVNSVKGTESGKQIPTWLNDKAHTRSTVKIMSQEEFMDKKAQACLPTFNSLTIENQLFNTPSDTDYMFALSDDMLLGSQHAASDIISPLFGPVMGFKTNQYNTVKPPTEEDAHRFGEKPYLIYTSWLLNRRFGQRKRKGQGHFGHALSRDIMREAIGSFPGPELESACKRFRGEPGFQLYSWFVTFHYTIERYREAMLWSLITLRADTDGDGHLSWNERKVLMSALAKGMANEGKISYRKRIFYHVREHLEKAGIEAPKVNTDFVWTSLDGPSSFINLQCEEFDVNECLAPGFSVSMNGYKGNTPAFSAAVIFERVARQKPDCGDCLLKLVLNQVRQGLEPILPDAKANPEERDLAVKALMRYKYSIVEPNGFFTMLTDAEQIDKMLVEKFVRHRATVPGQLCLNDDVTTTDESELLDIQHAVKEFYEGLFPKKSDFEV